MIPHLRSIASGLLALAAIAGDALAQASPHELLREINRDVWTPFAQAYADHDVDAYLRLHARGFVRGEGNRKKVSGLEEYGRDMREFFARNRERGARFSIGFRFTERLARDDLASERGIFRFTTTPKEGAPIHFYGYFHVVHRREGGTWRLVFDYDANEGRTIGTAQYEAAAAQDDFARF